MNLQNIDQQIMYLQQQLGMIPNPPRTQQEYQVMQQLQGQLQMMYQQRAQLVGQYQQQYPMQQGYQQGFQQQGYYQQPMMQQRPQASQYGGMQQNASFAQPYQNQYVQQPYKTQVQATQASTDRYAKRVEKMREERASNPVYQQQVTQQPQPVVEPKPVMFYPGEELPRVCQPDREERLVEEGGFTRREIVTKPGGKPMEDLKVYKKRIEDINTLDMWDIHKKHEELVEHDALVGNGYTRTFGRVIGKDRIEKNLELVEQLKTMTPDNIAQIFSDLEDWCYFISRQFHSRYTDTFNTMVKGRTRLKVTIDNIIIDIGDVLKFIETIENVKDKSVYESIIMYIIHDIRNNVEIDFTMVENIPNRAMCHICYKQDILIVDSPELLEAVKQTMDKTIDKLGIVTEESFPVLNKVIKETKINKLPVAQFRILSNGNFKDYELLNDGDNTLIRDKIDFLTTSM